MAGVKVNSYHSFSSKLALDVCAISQLSWPFMLIVLVYLFGGDSQFKTIQNLYCSFYVSADPLLVGECFFLFCDRIFVAGRDFTLWRDLQIRALEQTCLHEFAAAKGDGRFGSVGLGWLICVCVCVCVCVCLCVCVSVCVCVCGHSIYKLSQVKKPWESCKVNSRGPILLLLVIGQRRGQWQELKTYLLTVPGC